jgi:hypothetical protein
LATNEVNKESDGCVEYLLSIVDETIWLIDEGKDIYGWLKDV